MSTTIKKCNCKPTPSHAADFQDAKYGVGNRVHNLDVKNTTATCTVCNKQQKL